MAHGAVVFVVVDPEVAISDDVAENEDHQRFEGRLVPILSPTGRISFATGVWLEFSPLAER